MFHNPFFTVSRLSRCNAIADGGRFSGVKVVKKCARFANVGTQGRRALDQSTHGHSCIENRSTVHHHVSHGDHPVGGKINHVNISSAYSSRRHSPPNHGTQSGLPAVKVGKFQDMVSHSLVLAQEKAPTAIGADLFRGLASQHEADEVSHPSVFRTFVDHRRKSIHASFHLHVKKRYGWSQNQHHQQWMIVGEND